MTNINVFQMKLDKKNSEFSCGLQEVKVAYFMVHFTMASVTLLLFPRRAAKLSKLIPLA